jgi:diguanylate cyclase (GGDEF)-like protein
VWRFNADRSEIVCEDLFKLIDQIHEKGLRLRAEQYPKYFKALEESRTIAANDACLDTRTSEFAEGYLKPLGITSMMDVPVRLHGKVIGIVCHEHVGSKRDWILEEQDFAASIADMVSLALEAFERRRAEERLNYLAYHDSLTTLPNRLLLIDRLKQALIAAHHYQHQVAILSIDLDQFKRVNDTLGYEIGDRLLREISNRFKSVLNETVTLSRTRGNEFIVLLPKIAQTEGAIVVADRISKTLESPFLIDGHELFITCSIGISFFPSDGKDEDTLMKNAGTAKSRAKETGGNHYQLYSSSMNIKALERLTLENNLRRALERNEFLVYYQPIIDLKKRHVVGAEALLRWQHPSVGLISPQEFIPVMEETRLIVPIGEWVLRAACLQNKAWRDGGLFDFHVSVNLSSRQFQYANLVQLVGKVLKETGLDPGSLELELTESTIMQNVEESISTLRELHAMGINLSIDDFGTGYSSLSYLKQFPINTVKIDRSFINELATTTKDAEISQAIILMAHSLKLDVVAEGVETEAQLKFLISHKCDKVQGDFFSEPVPAVTLMKVLKNGRLLEPLGKPRRHKNN